MTTHETWQCMRYVRRRLVLTSGTPTQPTGMRGNVYAEGCAESFNASVRHEAIPSLSLPRRALIITHSISGAGASITVRFPHSLQTNALQQHPGRPHPNSRSSSGVQSTSSAAPLH